MLQRGTGNCDAMDTGGRKRKAEDIDADDDDGPIVVSLDEGSIRFHDHPLGTTHQHQTPDRQAAPNTFARLPRFRHAQTRDCHDHKLCAWCRLRNATGPSSSRVIERGGKSCTHSVAWPPGLDGPGTPPPPCQCPAAKEFAFPLDPFQQVAIDALEAGACWYGTAACSLQFK